MMRKGFVVNLCAGPAPRSRASPTHFFHWAALFLFVLDWANTHKLGSQPNCILNLFAALRCCLEMTGPPRSNKNGGLIRDVVARLSKFLGLNGAEAIHREPPPLPVLILPQTS